MRSTVRTNATRPACRQVCAEHFIIVCIRLCGGVGEGVIFFLRIIVKRFGSAEHQLLMGYGL